MNPQQQNLINTIYNYYDKPWKWLEAKHWGCYKTSVLLAGCNSISISLLKCIHINVKHVFLNAEASFRVLSFLQHLVCVNQTWCIFPTGVAHFSKWEHGNLTWVWTKTTGPRATQWTALGPVNLNVVQLQRESNLTLNWHSFKKWTRHVYFWLQHSLVDASC